MCGVRAVSDVQSLIDELPMIRVMDDEDADALTVEIQGVLKELMELRVKHGK